MKWIGQNIYDQVSKFRNTVDFSKDVTFYQPVNDADPSISLGASDDERFRVQIFYAGTTTQTAQIVKFQTFTESGTANDGRYHFGVDGVGILRIQDNGLKLEAGKGININDIDILTDNGSGVATLSNIDAIDSTTAATLNAALTAGDITGVTAGTGLSGGGTSGAVTLNVDAAQNGITSLGTLTELTVDNISIDGDTITASADLEITATGNDIKVDTDNFVITSATGGRPLLALEATNTTPFLSAELKFLKDASNTMNGEYLGSIGWYGDNNNGTPETIQYSRIYSRTADVTDGEEAGNLFLAVASYDGILTNGLQILGDTDEDGEVNVTIASGDASTTTVAGDLTVTSDLSVMGDNVLFHSATSQKPFITIKNTTASNKPSILFFVKDKGAAGADGDYINETHYISDNDAQEQISMVYTMGGVSDATDGAEEGEYTISVKNTAHASHPQTSLLLTGNGAHTDATIGSGTSSVTTLTGTLTMGSTAALDNSGLVAVANQSNITGLGTISSGVWNGTAIAQAQIAGDAINGDKIADDAVDSEHYTDGSIDTAHIADDQVTFAKALGVTPNVFGSVIKLIPSDFVSNDDGGNQKYGIGYVDHAGTGYGMRGANTNTELYAFVSIPQGMTATHVDIFDKNDLAIEVFEAQINATTMTSKGSGNANTTLDITDVASTATNFLAIRVTTTNFTDDRIYGGTVTIA